MLSSVFVLPRVLLGREVDAVGSLDDVAVDIAQEAGAHSNIDIALEKRLQVGPELRTKIPLRRVHESLQIAFDQNPQSDVKV